MVVVDEIVEVGNEASLLVKDETGRARALVADLVSRDDGASRRGKCAEARALIDSDPHISCHAR